LQYEYDVAGRRTTTAGTFARTGLPNPLTSASYNANNQVTQWGAPALSYDANGNLTSDGVNTYTWNARNVLASIAGGTSATFQYDPFGRRVSKSIGGSAQSYLYDGLNIVQELNGSNPTANLVNAGLDEIVARTYSGVTSYFLADILGNTIALTDTAGAVQTQYSYEPFGQTIATGASNTNQRQFTGRESDGTGLYFYRARYYNPVLERFISEDPIGIAGGINLYGYVGNDPSNFTDPFGLNPSPGRSGKSDCTAGGQFVCDCKGNRVGLGNPPGTDVPLGDDPVFFAAGFVAAGLTAAGAAEADEPFVPDKAWTKDAPRHVEPGTKTLEHTKYNPKTGEWEKSTVHYDGYGRQVGRTDYTNHGRSWDHPSPHYHTTEYGPGRSFGQESSPIPGEFCRR